MIILIYVQLTRPKSFVYLPRNVQRFSAGGFWHHAGLADLRGLASRDEGFGPIGIREQGSGLGIRVQEFRAG